MAEATGQTWSERVQAICEEAIDQGRARGMHRVATSHWSVLGSLFRGWDVDVESFDQLSMDRHHQNAVMRELDVMAAFATFVVFFPRRKDVGKKNSVRKKNSVEYALCVLLSIQPVYAEQYGHRTGLGKEGVSDYTLQKAMAGLRELAPHVKKRKILIF